MNLYWVQISRQKDKYENSTGYQLDEYAVVAPTKEEAIEKVRSKYSDEVWNDPKASKEADLYEEGFMRI